MRVYSHERRRFNYIMQVNSRNASLLVSGEVCMAWEGHEAMTVQGGTGRVNQKTRTRMAILRAASELMFTGSDVTMPEIAGAALVSEATAYRYFPDLATLLQAAMAEHLPEPADALASVAGSTDPAERVAAATDFLLRLV